MGNTPHCFAGEMNLVEPRKVTFEMTIMYLLNWPISPSWKHKHMAFS